MNLNCGAERHHYSMFDPPEADSMFDVESFLCSMLDVHLFKQAVRGTA
jgi:hypothetical protein